MSAGSGRPERVDWRGVALTIAVYALAWALARWISHPNLDRYHDMLESFAWSQTFEWGSFKHPPFFAWVTGAWFAVIPRTDFAFTLLAYANVAVGLTGVAVLARLAGHAPLAHPAVVLLFWCLPYTTLAAKFNANSQLLSVWPWAAAALFGSLNHRGLRGWLWSTLLGLLSAAALLSKYYSGMLLLALFVAAAVHPSARTWFLSARPWWALAVTIGALVPHAWWLKESGFAMLHYAFDQGGGAVNMAMVLRFALAPLFYWAPGWIACVLLAAWALTRSGSQPHVARLALRAWQPAGWRDSLFWLAFLPWAVSLGFGLAGAVELSTPWAIPIGFAFPLLWLRNLGREVEAAAPVPQGLSPLTPLLARLVEPRVSAAVAALVIAGAGVLAIFYALTGHSEYYRATESLARAVTHDWQARHPEQRLGWSGGAWPDNAMLAFYINPAIRALPGLPDSREASLAPHVWETEHGVLLCPSGAADCASRAQAWLQARGLSASPRIISASQVGWRFPKPSERSLLVYDVAPLPPPVRRAP